MEGAHIYAPNTEWGGFMIRPIGSREFINKSKITSFEDAMKIAREHIDMGYRFVEIYSQWLDPSCYQEPVNSLVCRLEEAIKKVPVPNKRGRIADFAD